MITAGNTLTLGSAGINMSAASNNLEISSGLTLLANTSQLWNVQTGRTLTLDTGTFTRSAGATLNVQGAGTVATSNISNDATGIIGAWASFGTGGSTKYATVSGGNIAAYTGTAAADGSGLTDTTGTVNYDLATFGGTVPATVSANTIRYTGASGTTAPGATSFSVNGLMNAGSGAWTIGTNTLTIGGNKELIVNSANNAITISSIIANNGGGASSLTATGGNILTLSGVNTFSGGLTVDNGATVTAGTSANSTGSGGVVDNGTLNLTVGAVTYTGLSTSLAGSGVVNVTLGTGSNTTVLSGNYSGFTGTWNIGVGATAGAGKAQMTGADNAAATINVLANGTVYASSSTTHNASIVLNGGDTGESYGQLRLEGGANWAGSVTLAGAITGSGDAFIGGNGTGTISGNIGETGGPKVLSVIGSGTMTLSGSNTYSGGTVLNGAGTLSISSDGAGGSNTNLGATTSGITFNGGALQITGTAITGFGSHTPTINAGKVFSLDINNAANTFTYNTAITGTGGITKNGAGTLTLGGKITETTANGIITVGAGTLNLTNTGGNSATLVNLNAGTIDIGAGNLTITPSTAGGNVLQSTAITGTVTVNATGGGALILTQNNAADGGNVGIANGGTLAINAKITGANAFEAYNSNNGTGVVVLGNAANDFTGNVLINSGVLQVTSVGNQSSTTSNLGAGTTISFGSTSASTGTLKYIGTGEVSNRIINLSGSTAGGTLDASGASGTLEFSSNLTAVAGAKTLTLQGSGLGKFSGNLVNGSGTVAIAKGGAGTWTLSGAANTYGGGTTVNLGTLSFAGAGAFPTSSNPVTLNGGTFQILQDGAGSAGTISLGNAVTVATGTTLTVAVGNNTGNTGNTVAFGALNNGTTANNLTSTINFTGANSYLQSYTSLGLSGSSGGATTLAPSTGVTISGNVTNQESGSVTGHYDTLVLDGTSTGNAINGTIADSGGYASVGNGDTRVTKQNSSTWTLAGSNTYHGATTLTLGTLNLNNNSALGSSVLTVNGGGIDNTSGTAKTLANQFIIGGSFAVFSGGETATSNLTFSTASTTTTDISKTITLNGTGTTLDLGQMTLTNNNNAGRTLTVNGAGNTLVLGALNLDSGGNTASTQIINGSGNVTINGAVATGTSTVAQSLSYSGTGTLSLGGANSYAGATTVNSGTMDFTGGTSTGSTSLVVHGTTAVPAAFKIETGASETIAGGIAIAQVTGDTNGSLTIAGGTLAETGANAFTVGDNNGGNGGTASGSVTQTGGTLNLGTVGTPSGYASVGAANVGTYTLSGGTINSYTTAGFNIGDRTGSTGTMTVSGTGVLNVLTSDGLYIGKGGTAANTSATGTLNVNSGGAVNTPKISFGNAAGTTGTNVGTLNLNGGTLTVGTSGISKVGSMSNPTIHMNGGTLKSSAAFALGANIVIDVDTGGAFVDTTGGTITASSAFLLGNGVGALTLTGGNSLILPTGNTYTGTTTITGSATTLKFSGATSLVNSVAIGTTALFDLNGNSQSVAGLNNVAGAGGAVIATGTAGKTLTLNGSGAYSFAGVYSGGVAAGTSGTGTLTVALTGGGSQTLTGANTYTGATAVNSGSLILGSGGRLAATAVTIASGATLAVTPGVASATNAVSTSSLALNSGSNFSMADGVASTATVGTTGTLSGANFTFDLGGSTTATDTLTIGGAVTLAAGNTITINGFGTTAPTAASYTLIGGASGLGTAADFTLTNTRVAFNGSYYPISLSNSATAEKLVVGAAGSGALYWNGTTSLWNSTTNWNTDATSSTNAGATPTGATDVFFSTTTPSPGNLTNTLGVATAVNSINYLSTSGAVTIGNSGTSYGLTIGAGGISDASASAQLIGTSAQSPLQRRRAGTTATAAL